MKSSINIVVPILFMHKETVVFISFCSEDHVYRNAVFFSNLFFCYPANSNQQDILYYNNLLQRTIKSNKTGRPNQPSTNPASCLVTSFEPCRARNHV